MPSAHTGVVAFNEGEDARGRALLPVGGSAPRRQHRNRYMATRSHKNLNQSMKIFLVLFWGTLLIPAFLPAHGQSTELSPSDGSGEWTTWTSEDGLPENEVRAVFQDSQGHLWFGTRNKGIGVFDGSSWTYYSTDDGLASNGILSIVEDRDGTIWAAGGGGYSTFDGNVWVPHDSLGTLQTRVIFSINLDSRGHLWFSTNGGASGFTGDVWQHYTAADGLPHQVVHSTLRDQTNNVWFACRRGLAQLADGEMLVHFPESNFGSILEDGAGGLWFGTRTSGVEPAARVAEMQASSLSRPNGACSASRHRASRSDLPNTSQTIGDGVLTHVPTNRSRFNRRCRKIL